MPDPAAPLPVPIGGGEAAWARLASDLKTVQQQALATQRALDQLQAQQEAPAHTSVWPVGITLPAGGWAVVVALLVGSAWLAWRARRRPVPVVAQATGESMASNFADNPSSMMALQQMAQEEGISQWAPVTEAEDDRVSDWGAVPLVPPAPATTFDLEAATSEVTRVRKTLAQRRQERAMQRERDARLLREAAERAAEADLALKLQDVPHRGFWVPDFDLSRDLDAHLTAAPAAPGAEPFTESVPDSDSDSDSAPQAVLPHHPVETPPMQTNAPEAEWVQAPSPAPLAEPDDTPVDVYAVKLALAHESEAVALWDEASALAEEVLASPDAALRTQAQATLQRLALQIQSEQQGANGVPTTPAPTPAPAAQPEPLPEAQQDVYAVKLALAQESAAIELWDEALELADEVLDAPDPALVAQAQALRAEIQQKLDAIAQDTMAPDASVDVGKPGTR